jgi:hypothetical protein
MIVLALCGLKATGASVDPEPAQLQPPARGATSKFIGHAAESLAGRVAVSYTGNIETTALGGSADTLIF